MNKFLFSLLLFTIISLGLFSQSSSYCPNIDFELGDTTNWNAGIGICCPISIGTVGFRTDRQTIVGPSGYDPKIPSPNQIPLVPPGGGNYAIRLGNSNVNREAEELSY